MVPPRQYMMNMVSQQLVKHQKPNAATIVTGDFNSKWGLDAQHSSDKAFNSWAEAAGLVNGAYEVVTALKIPLLTKSKRDGGTWIDHLLHTYRQNNIL